MWHDTCALWICTHTERRGLKHHSGPSYSNQRWKEQKLNSCGERRTSFPMIVSKRCNCCCSSRCRSNLHHWLPHHSSGNIKMWKAECLQQCTVHSRSSADGEAERMFPPTFSSKEVKRHQQEVENSGNAPLLDCLQCKARRVLCYDSEPRSAA